jgi:hypothetical protein
MKIIVPARIWDFFGTFCNEFVRWQEVALKQHNVMVAHVMLFCTVMLGTKEIYKFGRLVDGRLM